jgi:endonuclease/exonuclease/phosphatase family metal-dependent hydrolase
MRTKKILILLALLPVLMISFSSPAQETGLLSAMTWNIRLDTDSDGECAWRFRKDGLAAEIMRQQPDVLGVQEALYNQMKFLRKKLKGFKSIGVGRDDGKNGGEFSAVFYNSSVVKAIRSGTFWLSETPDIAGSRGWDAACNRVVTWAEFEVKSSKKRFIFMNTHFDHQGDTARIESAALLIRKAAELSNNNLPVVVAGDFNVTAQHRAYRILTYADNEIVLSDSRKRNGVLVSGPDFTFTGFDRNFSPERIIDYLFTTWDVEVISNNITDFRDQWPYLSDHLPVTIQFKIN